MIELVSKDRCSGCSACFNACKIGALSLETDETGFWFPKINREKCIECGACVKVCPALDKPEYVSEAPKAYIVQSKDDEIRRQSTSGGAFTAIARRVIANGGVVFGASIDEEYKVSHVWVENEEDLSKFRGSKYVQSWIGSSYIDAEKILKTGREVGFSGTPCQIYALKKYLGREYENLLTVDVMCRAVPSPKVLNRYLEYQKEKHPGFDRIIFRDKTLGYSYTTVSLYQGNTNVYREGSESDPWLRLFLGGFCNRSSCYSCIYQGSSRASDITLCDWWDVSDVEKRMDDNKGTTGIAVWTAKGRRALERSLENCKYKEIPFLEIDKRLQSRNKIIKPQTEGFYLDINTLPADQFINRYVPRTRKTTIKRNLRRIMVKLHLHEFIRRLKHKMK